MKKASCAIAASIASVCLTAGGFVAHADPDGGTAPAAAQIPPIPTEYRQAITDAGKTCPQVDSPLLAAVLSQETGFRSDQTSPAGMISVGQVPPQVWEKFAREGEKPEDPVAGTHVTARYLCSVAKDAEKITAGASAEGKTALLLTAYSAGQDFAARVRDGAALADPATAQVLRETTVYTSRVLEVRDAYKKEGI